MEFEDADVGLLDRLQPERSSHRTGSPLEKISDQILGIVTMKDLIS